MSDTTVQVTGGVETLTITGAPPGTHLLVETLDPDGAARPIATLVADHAGNAHLAFVPPEPTVIRDGDDLAAAIATGHTLAPGMSKRSLEVAMPTCIAAY